jgi:hypothetical protein
MLLLQAGSKRLKSKSNLSKMHCEAGLNNRLRLHLRCEFCGSFSRERKGVKKQNGTANEMTRDMPSARQPLAGQSLQQGKNFLRKPYAVTL